MHFGIRGKLLPNSLEVRPQAEDHQAEDTESSKMIKKDATFFGGDVLFLRRDHFLFHMNESIDLFWKCTFENIYEYLQYLNVQ